MESIFLHILLDEKVVNSFIYMMEECFPNQSTYLIIAKDGLLKRVKEREDILSLDGESKELKHFLSNISRYKHVCLHSMLGRKFYTYIHHPSISWVIWGVDLYGPLLQSKGYELYYDEAQQYRVRAGRMPVWLYKILTTIRDRQTARREEIMINRMRYIITDNGCDYDVFKKYYGDKSITFYGTINYYPIESLIDPSKHGEVCSGNAIWVGNSADANGNNVWVFEKLAGFSDDITIMSPISYGDVRFMKFIDEEGKRLLGKKFAPLKDFLPVNEYYAKFLQANAFIFGHFRQCAVGNILMALYFGGKVFLSNRNPLLPMYKKSGFYIYSIEDDLSESFALKPLDDEQRKKNLDLVMSIASYESSIDQLRNVFGKIKADFQ